MTDKPGETRRELNRFAATKREPAARIGGEPAQQPPPGHGATRRENAGATRREGGGLQVGLPPELATRFEVVEQRAGRGTEGFVFVCRDHQRKGELCAVKVYAQGVAPHPEVHQALLQARDDANLSVIRLEDVLDSDGHVVEVLEWAERGSLDKLAARDADLAEFIDAMWRAVGDFQTVVGGGHFDVKPANVLVRSTNPLDLVLCDLGLARVVDGSVRHSAQAGTIAYAPPEAGMGWGEVAKSPAWDWWSVGIIIAEQALGHHPLALPDGTLPRDADLAQSAELKGYRRVDLAGIGDQRIQALCTGLLTPQATTRWTVRQVGEWLQGNDPDIADGLLAATPPADRRAATVLFAGQEYNNPADLAAALQDDWSRAQELLFQARDRVLVDEVNQLARAWEVPETADLLAKAPAPQEVPRHMARLLLALDPELHPVFDGIELSTGGLEEAALAARDGTGEPAGDRAYQRLTTIRNAQVLRLWRHLPDLEHAVRVDDQWSTQTKLVDAVIDTMTASLDNQTTAIRRRAHLDVLIAALAQQHRDRLLDRAQSLTVDPKHAPAWWNNLAARDRHPATAAIMVAASGLAEAEAGDARERHRQSEQLRQAEAEAAEKARKKQERSEADRKRTQVRRERLNRRARFAATAQGQLAWLVRAAVAAGLYAEWQTGQQSDRFFPPGGPLFGWDIPVIVIVAASLLWKLSDSTGGGRLLSGPAALAAAYLFREDRGVELGDLVDLDQLSANTELMAASAYVAAACLTFSHAVAYFIETQARSSANDNQSADSLWRQDRDLMRTTVLTAVTCIVPAVVGAVIIARSLDGDTPAQSFWLLIRASPLDMFFAAVGRGVWLPFLVGALLLAARGRWTRRAQGMAAAAGFAVLAPFLWTVGGEISDERLAAAAETTETTAPPISIVENYRRCARYWTGTTQPTLTYIGGAQACDTLYSYDGWTMAWSAPLTDYGTVDDLVAMDDRYIAIFSDPASAVAFNATTGATAWQMPCAGTEIVVDERQLDSGEDTPANQRFSGRCSNSRFDLDPSTGR